MHPRGGESSGFLFTYSIGRASFLIERRFLHGKMAGFGDSPEWHDGWNEEYRNHQLKYLPEGGRVLGGMNGYDSIACFSSILEVWQWYGRKAKNRISH
jgi:hypothetical protein